MRRARYAMPVLKCFQSRQPTAAAGRFPARREPRRRMSQPVMLKRASASRPSGEGNEDDFEVLANCGSRVRDAWAISRRPPADTRRAAPRGRWLWPLRHPRTSRHIGPPEMPHRACCVSLWGDRLQRAGSERSQMQQRHAGNCDGRLLRDGVIEIETLWQARQSAPADHR